ncbi:MAG: Gfo/Idh/MocA family oxidoreductase [Treponemataceae bacterium]
MRFGIVGTGMIAEFHAKAISELPGCSVVACMDSIAERSDLFSRKYGCAGYSDLGKFLAHPGMDIVTICTPSGAHMETAVAAAEAGKHLIVEKPIEVTLDRIDAIIEACDKKGVSLTGVFMSRYGEAARILKKAVDGGRFGRLVMGGAHIKWWRSQEYYDKGVWKGTKRFDGGGALINQGIHAIDLLQWYMGPVDSVFAYGAMLAHERIEVEDTAVAAIRFKSGALGIVEGSTAAYPGFPKRIEISGSAGSATLEEDTLPAWSFAEERSEDADIRNRFPAAIGVGGAADPAAIGYEGHKRQFADVVKALGAGEKTLVDGREARKAVELILAFYRSAETGREVKLPL